MKQLLLPDPTNSLSYDGENQIVRNMIRAVVAARLANYHLSHPEAPSSILGSGSNNINTLEQLAVFEKWSTTNYFIHDNRITFPFATMEIARSHSQNREYHEATSESIGATGFTLW